MSVNLEDFPPTPAELAEFVKTWRYMHKWKQATLAEKAGITERTVQRVENGEPSDLGTRRGLARAFGCEDLDVFNKSCPALNIEKVKADLAELEKKTVVVPIMRIKDSRTLRTIWEGAFGAATEELGELSTDARQAFAEIVDYLKDYDLIREAYSMTQRLEVDRDIDALLKTIADEGAIVGAGLRHARFQSDAPNCEAMNWTYIIVVLAPKNALPSNVRVPKTFRLE